MGARLRKHDHKYAERLDLSVQSMGKVVHRHAESAPSSEIEEQRRQAAKAFELAKKDASVRLVQRVYRGHKYRKEMFSREQCELAMIKVGDRGYSVYLGVTSLVVMIKVGDPGYSVYL